MKRIGLLIILALSTCGLLLSAQSGEKPNFLFIAVDDLKPNLGCYGDTLAHTPHIDALAAKGVSFTHTYCQQAVCAPTRASLMTSRYPDQTRVWDLNTQMRDMNPDIVTLPQYLIGKGYQTRGTGKIFDGRSVDSSKDKPSWSVAFRNAWDPKYYDEVAGKPSMYFYASQHAKDTIALLEAEAAALGVDKVTYVKERYFPAIENADVPYDAYSDGAVANVGVELMEEAVASGKPFFLAVGFSRPHLPFNAPSEFWDLYNREDFQLAPFREQAAGSPSLAYHSSSELRSYTGIPKEGNLPEAQQLELIHAYYAATSYIDSLVGMLTKRLDELGVADNTIIVLWGDHGWHLGDHSLWCKHSNFEQATRVPLIFHYPNQANPGSTCQSPVEFTDIAPTLLDLADIKIPAYFEGESLSPLMTDTLATIREGSLSQYPRNSTMGYSLRTERFRYTRWNYADGSMAARELYDYQEDPLETINRVFYPEHEALVSRLDSIVVSRIAVPSTQPKIRFLIQGENIEGAFGPLNGVSVTMADETLKSDKNGELFFTHVQGESTYSLELSGYKDQSRNLLISGDTLLNINLELEDPYYSLLIKASDKYSGKALINASLILDGEEHSTDNKGEFLSFLKFGNHTISLQKDRYPIYEDTINLEKDTAFHYRLAASIADIKIRLREGSTPVNNASVSLDEFELMSNSLGISRFDSLPTGDTYLYTAEKNGYQLLSGSLFLNADTTVDLQMERITAVNPESTSTLARIWPNPAKSLLHLKTNEIIKNKRVEIVDVNGRVLMEFAVAGHYAGLKIAPLTAGVYWVRWESEEGMATIKFLKD